MENIAVFPGSFDPITRGHDAIIRRALLLFDQIIVAVGENHEKESYFTIEKRLGWLDKIFGNKPGIRIERYSGLTVDFCRKVNARFILRGLRTSADFEYERLVGLTNKALSPDIETVFLLSSPEYNALSSSIVRDVLRNGGDVTTFIPEGIDLRNR